MSSFLSNDIMSAQLNTCRRLLIPAIQALAHSEFICSEILSGGGTALVPGLRRVPGQGVMFVERRYCVVPGAGFEPARIQSEGF